jgi:hypothetical protein
MIEDLVRLINLGIITVDSIKDADIKAQVQEKLAAI